MRKVGEASGAGKPTFLQANVHSMFHLFSNEVTYGA
jgi:hypothetical protein